MDANRQKIIDRVKKLLAMADATSGASENEMEQALEKVQAAMLEHHITAEEIDAPEELAWLGTPPGRPIDPDDIMLTDDNPWRKTIAHAVGVMCFALAYGRPEGKKGNKKRYYTFYGKEADVIVARMMTHYLWEAVRLRSNEASRDYAPKERPIYKVSFRNLAAAHIAKRIEDRMAGKITDGVTGRELIVLPLYAETQANLAAAVGAGTKAISLSMRHTEGMIDGFKAGGEIGLDLQVEAGARKGRVLRG